MTILYLCEKPSQARDIGSVLGATKRADGAILGEGVAVTWCIGHLLEMSPPDAYDPALKQWRFAGLPILPDRWRMEVTKRGRKQYKAVKAWLGKASEVVIATDADREGEMIAREVMDRCNWRGQTRRLWLSALDPASIRKALNNMLPGDKTESLYQAGLSRSRADWLIGMNLTRAYTVAAREQGHDILLTVGRVQTPTLKLVVDRDRLIEAFEPVPYFNLIGRFSTDAGDFLAKWVPSGTTLDQDGHCISKQVAIDLAQRLIDKRGRIIKAVTERKKEAAPLPFSLSALQQEASRRWGMGATSVLDLVQSLYETHKATSYPRTDSPYLPLSQLDDAPVVLQSLAQSDNRLEALVQKADTSLRSRCWNDKKITAHHAIIPTSAVIDVDKLSAAELQVYDLIRRRYLAQFYPRYEYDQTRVEVGLEGACFKASGRVAHAEGWREVVGRAPANEDKQALPPVREGQAAALSHAEIEAKQTKPPARYTEGTLIEAMMSIGKMVTDPKLKAVLKETAGIGTEATRASIIDMLKKRQYIAVKKKSLISTHLGRTLIDAIPAPVKDPATTAVWEQHLEAIADNQLQPDVFMAQQAEHVRQLVQAVSSGSSGAGLAPGRLQVSDETHLCPTCGQPMRRRKAKASGEWFWGCTAYPDCKTTLPDNKGKPGSRARKKSPRPARSSSVSESAAVGVICPDCGTGTQVQRLLKKSGPNEGKSFIGCTNFPKCKFFSWPRTTAI